ncbi:unnamed protein product, partial [marine sediment metagenome]
MTLIIAAEGKDFVLLGSDSKATYDGNSGDVAVEANKCFEISKHVAILCADDGDIGHALIKRFKSVLPSKEDGCTNVTDCFIKFCRKDMAHITVCGEYLIPKTTFIIAGLDKKGREFCEPATYVVNTHDFFNLRSDDV